MAGAGLGIAIQAYQKRAVPLCEWVIEAARAHRRKLMIRLVKGAYWDTEIKAAQVAGLDDYPVFTRKVATDVSYLACARLLLAADDVIYPAFATHNANTIGQVKALAHGKALEFQRLHGMGEALYEELAELERHVGDAPTPVRIYAPVGSHKDLLAYLVRRLLENGANSTFVNRIADDEVQIEELVRHPVAELEALSAKRNPAIVRPTRDFRESAPQQRRDRPQRSAGARALAQAPGQARVQAMERGARPWHRQEAGHYRAVRPPDRGRNGGRGECQGCRADGRRGACGAAGLGCARRRGARASCSTAPPTSTRSIARSSSRCACARPGRPCPTPILEVREAVDFLRFYASEARRQFSRPDGPSRADRRAQ